MSGDMLPRKRDNVLVADFDTELVVLVTETRRAHRLDSGLSLVLGSCDGTTTRSELVDEIASGTGEARAQTKRWLDDALGQLAELDVFEPADENRVKRGRPPADERES
jgi:hypothetical protein